MGGSQTVDAAVCLFSTSGKQLHKNIQSALIIVTSTQIERHPSEALNWSRVTQYDFGTVQPLEKISS